MTTTREHDDFRSVLLAEGRSADVPESADAYGWLVGSWALDVVRYWAADVSSQGSKRKRTLPGFWRAAYCRTSGSCRGEWRARIT